MIQTKSPALIYAETHSFSHDLSHCNPHKNETEKCYSCKRYAAHLQLNIYEDRFKDGLYSYLSEPLKGCINKDHQYYLPTI